MNVTTLVLALGGTAYVIGRQVMGEALQVRRLLLIPLALTLWGANNLDHAGLAGVRMSDALLLVAAAVLAVGLGVARGLTVMLFARDGVLWCRSTLATLGVWVVSIVARVALIVVAHLLGASLAASTASLLLMLGLTLGAQSLVVYARGVRSGIGFAPDRRIRRVSGAAQGAE